MKIFTTKCLWHQSLLDFTAGFGLLMQFLPCKQCYLWYRLLSVCTVHCHSRLQEDKYLHLWTLDFSGRSTLKSSLHPSIYFLALILCRSSYRGGCSLSQLPREKITSWTSCQFIPGLKYRAIQPFTLSFTPLSNFRNLWEGAGVPTGNPCTQKGRDPVIKPKTFLLWRDIV